MSHIFDALQRSEADRFGTELPASPSATELLQRAELRAGSQGQSGMSPEERSGPEFADSDLSYAPQDLLAGALGQGLSVAADVSRTDEYWEVFNQFRVLEVPSSPQNRLVCLADKESPAAEAFRLLGVRLRHLRRDRPLKRILITSSVPQEGKSLVSANLACSIASGTRRRTLLVDGDLRRPSLSQIFELGSLPGVCDWLQGDRDLTSSIYHLEAPGIWILPAGNTPGNPLELIQSTRVPALMDELSALFDWIIIDSPPVLPLADTSVWARLADGILLVARQGTTERRKLQRGLEALEPNKLIGALLNCFRGSMNEDYYYYRRQPDASRPADISTE